MDRILTKELDTNEDIKQAVSKQFELDKSLTSFIELNSKEIKKYIEALESGVKFTFLAGFSGVGKSELIKLTPTFLENSLSFSFDCFQTACLDDIIFSLYRYFTNIKSVKIQRLVKKTFSKTRSIDERIFELLKDFPVNFVIMFDSFENFIDKRTDRVPHEIAKFLDFLSEQENIRVVTASQVAPFELIKKYPFSKTVRVEPFNYDQFLEFKRVLGVQESKELLEIIFNNTNGVALSVQNFFNAAKGEDRKDFSDAATASKMEFNSYISMKLVRKLSSQEQEALYLLAAIRHPISKGAIAKIINNEDKKTFKNLLSSPYVYCFDDKYKVKEHIKVHLETIISKSAKSDIHEKLAEFYDAEVPLKHFERNIKLSRTTLRNEFAHHTKLVEKKKSKEVNMIASTLNTDVILFKDSKPLVEENNYPKTEKERIEREKVTRNILDEASSIASQNINIHQIEAQAEGIALSDEERKLLYEEAKELQKEDEKNKPKIKKKKALLIDGAPIDHDYKKSKIIDNSSFYKLLEAALDEEDNKNYRVAIGKFQEALAVCNIEEKVPLIHNKIAQCYTKLKKKTDAMGALKQAYEAATKIDDKQIAFVMLNMARTLREFGEYEESEKYFNNFLDMNILNQLPKGQIIIALLDLGDLYVDMNNEQNALTVYQTAMKQAGPSDPVLNEIYYKIGFTFDNMGNIEKAKSFYERASQSILDEGKSDKYYSESCSNLGLIYADEGDYKKALMLLEKAFLADKKSDHFEGLVQSASKLADTYFDIKDYKSAQKYYYEKLKASKEMKSPYLLATAYLDIGDVYIRINNLQKALRAFIMARKAIGKEISTDSKQKIERRISFIKSKLTKEEFEAAMRQK